jgi:hypothetical protein
VGLNKPFLSKSGLNDVSLGSGLGFLTNLATTGSLFLPKDSGASKALNIGADIAGAITGNPLAIAKTVLDVFSLFGGGDEPEPTWREKMAPSPIHRNITPELQAMADRHRQARMMR